MEEYVKKYAAGLVGFGLVIIGGVFIDLGFLFATAVCLIIIGFVTAIFGFAAPHIND